MLYFMDVDGDVWPASSGPLAVYDRAEGRTVECGNGVLFSPCDVDTARTVRDALIRVAVTASTGPCSTTTTRSTSRGACASYARKTAIGGRGSR